MPAVSILKLQPLDREVLPPALAEAITDEFLNDTGAPAFPIRLQPDLPLDGQCTPPETTEQYEVVIDLDSAHYCDSVALRCLYLHEVSHRLTGWRFAAPHDGRFACLYLVFLLRLGLQLRFTLYDMQDEPASWWWAWTTAVDLWDEPLDGFALVPEIERRYESALDEINRTRRAENRRQSIRRTVVAATAGLATIAAGLFSISR